jgi:hypothetical protein
LLIFFQPAICDIEIIVICLEYSVWIDKHNYQ